jgi:uncharacterized small protein (DUF1192 family)
MAKRTPIQKILRWTLLGATLAAGLQAASAQSVYKCLSPSGKVLYADAACAKNDTASTVSVQPNALGTAEYGDRLLRQEIDTLRAQLRAAQPSAAAAQATVTTADANVQAGRAPLPIDSVACTHAKRDYEVTASSSANPPGHPTATVRRRIRRLSLSGRAFAAKRRQCDQAACTTAGEASRKNAVTSAS